MYIITHTYTYIHEQVQKGLNLDYDVDESERIGEYQRPLDRHLNALEKKLSLKMSLYAAPDRLEDTAMLLVEQVCVCVCACTCMYILM
jgi:hypothetical protein